MFISVFDAKLPANATLNATNTIKFPGETELNFSDVRDVAEIVIPTDVLNQFSSNGMCIRTDDAESYYWCTLSLVRYFIKELANCYIPLCANM